MVVGFSSFMGGLPTNLALSFGVKPFTSHILSEGISSKGPFNSFNTTYRDCVNWDAPPWVKCSSGYQGSCVLEQGWVYTGLEGVLTKFTMLFLKASVETRWQARPPCPTATRVLELSRSLPRLRKNHHYITLSHQVHMPF